MIYEGLGLPRVEFAAADARDDDYDAYVPTYVPIYPLPLTYLSTYLPTYFRELFTLCTELHCNGALFRSPLASLSLLLCTYYTVEALCRSLTSR